MKGLQFTPIDVELTPNFERFTLGDILDTFGNMVDALENAEAAVCALAETAYTASERGGAMSPEKLMMSRYAFACEGAMILPLLGTHLASLKMTAQAMVEGLRDVARMEIKR